MAYIVSSPISGITIEHVSSGHGTGSATLTAKTADSLAWTGPGGSEGDAVSIANGEWKIVPDGTDADAFAVVKRTSASDLSGTATITITSYSTLLERLEEVDVAISKVMKAQSSGLGDARVQRATLETLQTMRRPIYREYLRQKGKVPVAGSADFTGLM